MLATLGQGAALPLENLDAVAAPVAEAAPSAADEFALEEETVIITNAASPADPADAEDEADAAAEEALEAEVSVK